MVVDCKESRYFFDVIISTIKGESVPEPPEMDWDKFVDTVVEQQFVSLVAQALENKSFVPEKIADRLSQFKNNEFLRIISVQNEFNEIKSMLVENKARFMLLKGSVIRNYYPKQSFRQMSDIDLLCDYEQHNAICDYMLSRGYTMLSDGGGNTDDFTKEPYFTFEFHHDLFKDVYGFCPDFSFVWDNAKLKDEGGFEYEMSVEDVYLHSVAHMYKHFILGGFGVKFIVDTYLLASGNESDWNRAYIDEKLESMNLGDFEKRVRKASFDFFENNLSASQQEFFQKAFKYGTFMNDENFANVEEILNNYQNDNGSSAFKYLLSRIFPSKVQIKSMYPVLNEKPYLLPLCYVKRIFKKIATGPKKVAKEMKYLTKSNKSKE